MRIYAEVSLFATLSDGTRVSVDYKVPHDCGDNPAFAGHEAELAVEKAAKVALRSFCAQVQPESTAVEAAPSPQPSTPAWLEPSQPPATEADLRRKLRDYTVNALDTAGVDPELNPDHARQVLRAAGLKTYATDAELESFQALRRQIRDGAP